LLPDQIEFNNCSVLLFENRADKTDNKMVLLPYKAAPLYDGAELKDHLWHLLRHGAALLHGGAVQLNHGAGPSNHLWELLHGGAALLRR
jgi:hypothetical protein